ncbi:60S ribosomal protein L27-3 [Hordeum vulgare]|nr:60S ribosomal protein L27-3 [Hordeum vulgare]
MVKFLKPGKAVSLLLGRYAGKKAVVVRVFEEGTRDRPYGHCVVAVLAKYPNTVIRKDSAKKSCVKAFLKLVHFTHLMPTRYTLDVDLKEVVSGAPDSLTTKDKKLTTNKSAKARQARGEEDEAEDDEEKDDEERVEEEEKEEKQSDEEDQYDDDDEPSSTQTTQLEKRKAPKKDWRSPPFHKPRPSQRKKNVDETR